MNICKKYFNDFSLQDSDRNITMNEESLDEICSEDFDSQRSSHIVDLIDVEEVKYSDILNVRANPVFPNLRM